MNQDDVSELESESNILRPPDAREISRVKPNPTLQVQPTFIDPGPSERPHKEKRSGKSINKGLCLEISGRVQHDRGEYKRFVEDHLESSSSNDHLQGQSSWNGVAHMEDDAECAAY